MPGVNELVRCADILVENFRPGVTNRLGVDFETMHEINPRLIYLSISGFGQDGPLAGKPAFDTVVQAMSGIMATTGTQDADPTRVGESVADIITGIYGAWALSTALYSRSVNNEGLYLDLAMFDALFTSQVTNLSQLIATNSAPGRIGNRHPASAPFDSFSASDGQVIIAAVTKTMFDQLCILMGQPNLSNDTRFLTEASRMQFEPELKEQDLQASVQDYKAAQRELSALEGAAMPDAAALAQLRAQSQEATQAMEQCMAQRTDKSLAFAEVCTRKPLRRRSCSWAP